jgi:hypothetical protein
MTPPATAPAASRLLASRPVPAVTRINSSPRVLDRVAGNGALRSTAAASRATEAAAAQEAPPIPSFLKLVKC